MKTLMDDAKNKIKTHYRKAIEAASGNNLERIFDVLSECVGGGFIFVEYIPGGISRWSREAVDYFGLPGTHILNGARTWGELIAPEDRASYMEMVKGLESGETDKMVYLTRIRDVEGIYHTMGCHARVIRSESGDPVFFTGVIQNFEELDNIDPVTGLYSQNNLLATIDHYLREKRPFVVSEFGIRDFFSFNTDYGYQEGNRLLKRVAEWLNEKKRSGVFCRSEGTKFVYVVAEEEHTVGDIHGMFDSLKNFLKNDVYVNGMHVEINICGGAMLVKDMSLDASTVYNSVQFAMAQAKEENQMKLLVYNEEMQNRSREHLASLNRIRRDVLGGCKGFFMVYQPIVSAEDEKVIGVEALVRYRNESGRIVPPNDFIPWLEKDTVFYELGRFILKRAMEDGKRIIKTHPDFIVNVNLAYPQLQREDFKADLKRIIEESGYDTKNLKLELTERCRLIDIESLRNDMVFFKSSGIQTALDDFGTGYSALGLLINLPVDQIKIDKSFIDDIEDNVPRQCLFEAITDCASKLGVFCCVEGIETAEMKDYIKSHYRVTSFQGYYYSRPVEIDELMDWISEYEKKSE